ncbi:MAG: arsenate reductase family protein [Provencibacterium sp.]|nr:arsenate reductase family protein [Provencibacterium sp.]
MILLVAYPGCSTCKKAEKWLEENGIAFTRRHIREENPTEQELRAWWEKSGLPLRRLFNTSGVQYRALGLKDRLEEMSEQQQLELLASDGMLVRRPVAVGEKTVLFGFRAAEWERLQQEKKE